MNTEYYTANGEFYQVIKRTEKTITLRPVKSKRLNRAGAWSLYCEQALPIKDAFVAARVNMQLTDQPFRRRLIQGLELVKLDDYAGTAALWRGELILTTTNLG